MGSFDEVVLVWRDATAVPRHRFAVARVRNAHQRALRAHARRVAMLHYRRQGRAVLAGASGVSATGLAVSGENVGLAGFLVLAAAGLGFGSLRARSQLARLVPPPPPALPVRPGTQAASYLLRLDHLGVRRERLAHLVDDDYAGSAFDSAAAAERRLRVAIHRMAAIEETAVGGVDASTDAVVSELGAEVSCGLESYELVICHAVQLAGVVSAGGTAIAELNDAAASLEARTYGLRRLGEIGPA